MSVYRAKKEAELDFPKRIKNHDTRRPPGNVPYVVDNLWEWVRPETYPDRRKSKFASPKAEQALRSAGLLADCLESTGVSEEEIASSGLPDECLKHVFRVEFVRDPVIAQLLGVEDARYHPDCQRVSSDTGYEHLEKDSESKHLREVLFEKLGGKFDWSSKKMKEKHPVGQLFQPCLTAKEVDYLFDIVDVLRSCKDEIQQEVTYWQDLELIDDPEELADEEKGEILFEFRGLDGEIGYRKQPVEKGR